MRADKIVREGYNKAAEKYYLKRVKGSFLATRKNIKKFINLLPKNAKVLDVGCGAGVPTTKLLIDSGLDVIGIDLSESMLKLARKNVPKARFIKKNMIRLNFKDNSFDGLTAIYSVIHVLRKKHFSVFLDFHKILKPNGIMLVTLGSEELEEISKEYLGVELLWSHYGPKRSLQIIKKAGFEIISDKFIVSSGEKHYWILAKNKK